MFQSQQFRVQKEWNINPYHHPFRTRKGQAEEAHKGLCSSHTGASTQQLTLNGWALYYCTISEAIVNHCMAKFKLTSLNLSKCSQVHTASGINLQMQYRQQDSGLMYQKDQHSSTVGQYVTTMSSEAQGRGGSRSPRQDVLMTQALPKTLLIPIFTLKLDPLSMMLKMHTNLQGF